MAQTTFIVSTSGQGLYEITREARAFVKKAKVDSGVLVVFARHTSASLIIQENADPDVRSDIQAFLERLVPLANDPSMRYLTHRMEGPDDMPAHLKSVLTQTSLAIPIGAGQLLLGTWQGIYLFEHRDAPHRREIVLHISS